MCTYDCQPPERAEIAEIPSGEVNNGEKHRCFFLHLFFVNTDFKRDSTGLAVITL